MPTEPASSNNRTVVDRITAVARSEPDPVAGSQPVATGKLS